MFCSFLNGINTYSREEYAKQDSFIISNCVINVESKPIPQNTHFDSLIHNLVSYVGKVNIKDKYKYKILEVQIPNGDGYLQFKEDSEKGLIITLTNQSKGKITKKANLIVLDSIGHKVVIPFSFSFDSR